MLLLESLLGKYFLNSIRYSFANFPLLHLNCIVERDCVQLVHVDIFFPFFPSPVDEERGNQDNGLFLYIVIPPSSDCNEFSFCNYDQQTNHLLSLCHGWLYSNEFHFLFESLVKRTIHGNDAYNKYE